MDTPDELNNQAPEPEVAATNWTDPFGNMPTIPTTPHPAWTKLADIYQGHPALSEPVLYALPQDLLDAINQGIPDFFSVKEATFERDLSALSGGGFFAQRPFTYLVLPRREWSREEEQKRNEMSSRQEEAASKIDNMLADEMRSSGYSDEQICSLKKERAEEKAKVEARQHSYAGWLVTDPGFRSERNLFREKWASTITELGAFPPLPMSLIREYPEPPPNRYREFYAEFTFFCRRWGLEGFATWDLPVPMQAELSGPSLYYLPAIQDAGLLTFIPWYLLRDKDIQLDDLARRVRMLQGPEHLREWLDHEPKDWGYDRFAAILKIYIYIELCLKSRYADRLKGNVDRLDYALAYFLHSGPDKEAGAEREAETIRKNRQLMNRRLKSCMASESPGQTFEADKDGESEREV